MSEQNAVDAAVQGPRPIDQIRQAMRDRRRSVVIPEFGDLELYFGPLTTQDQIDLDERIRDVHGKDPEVHEKERRILMLILKAETEDGEKAFSWGDRHYLLTEADSMGINRAIMCLYGQILTPEDAKKKSETTPASGSDSDSD